MKNVAKKLRQKREALGLSRERAVEYFRQHGYDFSPKSLQNWENGDRDPRDVDLQDLLDLLESYSAPPDKNGADKNVIDYGPASAGDGRNLEPKGTIEVDVERYRTLFGSRSVDEVGFFRIDGDSAVPVYFDGEHIPVEMIGDTQEFREDTVYVFRYNDDIMVKRLRSLGDDQIRAESLNPAIDNRILEINDDNFEIVGRVIDNEKQQLYTSLVGRFLRENGQEAS